jgi:hypothetical protein
MLRNGEGKRSMALSNAERQRRWRERRKARLAELEARLAKLERFPRPVGKQKAARKRK